MQKMSFKPPQLNEEEERSPHLIEEMGCDSCTAVAYQLHKAFENGQMGLAALRDHAAAAVEPDQISGKQELLENLVNDLMFAAD